MLIGPSPRFAAGMLLLNRSVFNGSSILFDTAGVPEAAFPLPCAQGGTAAGAAADNDEVGSACAAEAVDGVDGVTVEM